MTTTERDRFERDQLWLYRASGAFMFSGLFFMAAMAFGQLGSQLPLMICGAGLIVTASAGLVREFFDGEV